MKKISLLFFAIGVVFFSIAQPMHGNYTIGASGFQSFNSAVSELISNGVSGPTVFIIADGFYNESIVIPEILGASVINTITFVPKSLDSSAVTLISDDNATIKLDGADYIRFLHMGLKTHSYHALEYSNEANNNIVSNCIVEGDVTTSTLPGSALIYSSGYNDTNNVFQNTHFIGGSYGIHTIGGFSHEASTLVFNNIFDDQGENGIYLERQKRSKISNNTFNVIQGYYSIWVEESIENLQILNNKLWDGGLVVRYCIANSDSPNIIANNFVNTPYGSGIINHYSSFVYNVYNTVILSDGPGYTAAFYCGLSNTNIFAYNNIFINNCYNGGMAILIRSTLTSDFNVLHSTYSCVQSDMGSVQVYNYTSWVGSSGNDIHSKNLLPSFVNSSDFHTFDEDLNASAQYIDFVIYDIDGEERNTTNPDIGADEFTVVDNNEINKRLNYFTIFPNPSEEFINIHFNQKIIDSDELFLFSVQGRKIEIPIENVISKSEIIIKKEDYRLENGIYFITYITENNQYTKKILIID